MAGPRTVTRPWLPRRTAPSRPIRRRRGQCRSRLAQPEAAGRGAQDLRDKAHTGGTTQAGGPQAAGFKFTVFEVATRRRGSRLRPGEGRFGAACPSTPGPRCRPERARRPQHELLKLQRKLTGSPSPARGPGPFGHPVPSGTCHWQCGARRKLKLTRGCSGRRGRRGSWHSAGIIIIIILQRRILC